LSPGLNPNRNAQESNAKQYHLPVTESADNFIICLRVCPADSFPV
jgi:hypothetical protein